MMKRSKMALVFFALLCWIVPMSPEVANAATKIVKRKIIKKPIKKATNITISKKYSGLVIDYDNGRILYQKNPHTLRYPASLTKMMTLFLTFDAIKAGKLHMEQKIPISAIAARQPCSCLPVEAGEKITVREAIYAAIVKSANNATHALGEAIAGNGTRFAMLMNKKAKQLGMTKTRFKNPSGLPHPQQVTTAYDMAKLAIALRRDHSKHYHLFSTKSFAFRDNEIQTHNHVITRYKWADGMKTGYTKVSGFNLVTSTRRPGANLIAVVMGGDTAEERDDHMIKLLNYAYKKSKMIQLAQLGGRNRISNKSVFSLVKAQ